jgi:hypothetical protein
MRSLRISFLAAIVVIGCVGDTPDAGETPDTGGPAATDEVAADAGHAGVQTAFWSSLSELCGNAYEGRIIEDSTQDTAFAGKAMVMHVRSCSDNEIRIPFYVGDDRSRTWVLTRTDNGLRLKHDHRHEDGSEDEITQYGGDTGSAGTAEQQEFPADEHTASLIPAAATNVWTVEVVPGSVFAYALRREGTDRRFRVEFDLTSSVAAPPPPWGAEN